MGELFSELGQAVAYLADPIYWIAVVGAVFVAAFTGMIPGASGVLIMALAIPFIVEVFRGEQRAIGLVMLASMTGVNNTLDSIPAILFGQPSAATQVTFLEGHQLARQGKAAHTLGAVYAVSALGGIIGALVLGMLIPVSRPVILAFTPAEIAAVAFFGIAMVAALSAGAMVKGLTAGALGILLGTVGINPITGALRFVFDQPQLWNGLNSRAVLIPVVIGFFALPEMIDLAIARRPVAPPGSVVSTREVWRGSRDGLKRWPIMIRQSIFGVLMGAIPGVGAAVIDWLSYAFGIFWTKDKSQFGRGSLDGVLFAESAQNSKEAGQALPTLALGVPGGLAWALVFSAMVSLDLTPGPRLLGDLADITILFIITLAIGNLIVTMLGILMTGQLAKLTRIPYPMIGGIFIPISILAAVINMTSYLAIPIIFVFAGIGIIMKLFQWPRPPLLLGIILGPIIEENFLSAMSLVEPVYQIAWIQLTTPEGIAASRPSNISEALGVVIRPITLGLIVVAFATAFFFARSSRLQPRHLSSSPKDAHSVEGESGNSTSIAGASGTGPQAPGLMARLFHIRNFPIFLAIAGAGALYWGSLGFEQIESWFVPRAMAILIIALSLVQIAFHFRSSGRQSEIMDLGMHGVSLPGAKQAIILLAIAFLLFTILTGTIGLRWGTVALAGYLPFALLARVGSGAQAGVGAGVAAGALAGAAAAFFGDASMADIVVISASIALAVAVAFIIEAQGVGGIPTTPMALFIAAVAFGLAVLVVAIWNPWPPYLLAVALLPLALLFIRPLRELQPPQSIAWLFSWRLLGAAIAMGFVVIFEFVLADNVLFIIWPQPALIEWVGREILVPLGLQSA